MNTNRIMVGMLGCLGLAAGAGAACPPDECGAAALDHAKALPAPHVFTVVAGQGAGEHQGKTMVRRVRSDDLAPGVWTATGSTAPQFVLASLQPERAVRARVAARGVAGDQSARSMVIVQDDDTVAVKIENGKVVSVERNGKTVPLDKVKKEGNHVRILGDDDRTAVFEFDIGDDDAVAFSGPEGFKTLRNFYGDAGAPGAFTVAMAEPPKVMIGVQLGEPDGLLLGHFGLEPGAATLITGVYDNLPAGKAGLKPYDIIVAVDGDEPAGQAEVREALRDKEEGDKVRLTIIHRGERKDVEVKLVAYDQEALENAELDAIEQDVFAFSFGEGGPGNVFVAPGLGALRNFQGQDAEKWREFAEKWREQAEKFQHMNIPDVPDVPGGLGGIPAPTPPAVRGGPGAPAAEARWKQVEERLERLEKLLERLAEQRSGGR